MLQGMTKAKRRMRCNWLALTTMLGYGTNRLRSSLIQVGTLSGKRVNRVGGIMCDDVSGSSRNGALWNTFAIVRLEKTIVTRIHGGTCTMHVLKSHGAVGRDRLQ